VIEKSGFLSDELVYMYRLKEGETVDIKLVPHLEESRVTQDIAKLLQVNRENVFIWSLGDDVSSLNTLLSKYK
jgi:hypothetical protein